MENTNENIKKLETFLQYDLAIKQLLNGIFPQELDFYDAFSKSKYKEKILENINKIKKFLDQMMQTYNIPVNIWESWTSMYQELQRKINSETFSITVLERGYYQTLDWIHHFITSIRPEFVKSVNQNIKGSYMFSGQNVLPPNTINEFLHYTHSYVMNSDYVYDSIPILKTTVQDNWTGVSLRGRDSKIGTELYESIIKVSSSIDGIDIINLEKKILIMARGMGHATMLEIDIENENNIFVKYFIPKSINNEMISLLKGIKENNEIFASGDFITTKENIALDISNLLSGIPRDADYKR